MLIIAILIMAIGFAAISTTLIINGSAKVSENTEDFSVIFTSATLDGVDVYNQVIDSTKKIITFETSDLKTLNQTSVLNYEVTNNSNNYDAEVSVNCKLKDNSEVNHTSIKNELENNATVVKAKETLNGTLTVTLNKSATEEVKEEYVCELTFNAVERDALGYEGPTEWTFDYTGGEQTFTVPLSGTYKLETWGAQGGSYDETYYGGYGGYSTGEIKLEKDQNLFLSIGGSGSIGNSGNIVGGYNGGGTAFAQGDHSSYAGGGGGATHISVTLGVLSTLENKKDDILIVSGGGGGISRWLYNGSSFSYTSGGNAGGFTGKSPAVVSLGSAWKTTIATGGTQTSGGQGISGGVLNNGSYNTKYSGTFGKGASTDGNCGDSGAGGGGAGGGGFYGGGAGAVKGGAGGSSYIGNLLLTNKSMYCYDCEESTEESTKTVSTTCVSEIPTENCAKSGNGYARITLIKQK